MLSFDLPTVTETEKANYRKFNSYLKKNGYVLYQESLYFKLLGNISNSSAEIRKVSLNAPPDGDIVALPLTIGEISKIRTIRGNGINLDYLTDDIFFF